LLPPVKRQIACFGFAAISAFSDHLKAQKMPLWRTDYAAWSRAEITVRYHRTPIH